MTLAVVDFDASLIHHLRRAVSEHARWCRTNGLSVPSSLDDFIQFLDRAGQGATDVDPWAQMGDVAPVLFLPLDEVARRLAVSRRTVQRLVETGDLKVSLIGKQRRVHVDDLAEFADAQRQARPEIRATTKLHRMGPGPVPGPEIRARV